MKPRISMPAALLLLAAFGVGQVTVALPPSGEDPRTKGAKFATDNPPEFAWLMFLYLISPAKPGARGVPDKGKMIGAETIATVWETFRNASTIYLPDGSRPQPWEKGQEAPLRPGSPFYPSAETLKALGPVDSPSIQFLAEDRMIDGNQICTADSGSGAPAPKIVRYEVRDDRAAFDYIVNNHDRYELFNLDGQEAALKDSRFTFSFPREAVEIKASWRVLQPGDDASRYWTAIVAWQEQGTVKFARGGLTGLHFASKILPNWFWATFEQTDNATSIDTYFGMQVGSPVGVNKTFNPGAAPANDKFQRMLAGTKWAFYRLEGWQTDFVDGASQQPVILANTQMETSFAQSSSCMSCHLLANIGPGNAVRFDWQNTAGGNIGGYVGKVDFDQVGNRQFPGVKFKEMDYVWALRNAHEKAKGNR